MSENAKKLFAGYCKFPDCTIVKLDSIVHLSSGSTMITWTNYLGRTDTVFVPSEWVFLPKK